MSMAMPDKISDHQYQMLASFRYALRQFLRWSENAAQSIGLTPQQHQALLAVRGFGGSRHLSVSELAEKLQIRHHSAVGLVKRLVDNGLLERVADAGDRRLVLLTLTERGQDILAQLASVHRAELRHIGPHLNMLLEELTDDSTKTGE